MPEGGIFLPCCLAFLDNLETVLVSGDPEGGSLLVHTLAEHDLIDEYSLFVYPVVLGGGKKLFAEGLRVPLRLLEARPLPSGVVRMHYDTRDRPPAMHESALPFLWVDGLEGFHSSFKSLFEPLTHSSFAHSQSGSDVFLLPALCFQFPGAFASFFSPLGGSTVLPYLLF